MNSQSEFHEILCLYLDIVVQPFWTRPQCTSIEGILLSHSSLVNNFVVKFLLKRHKFLCPSKVFLGLLQFSQSLGQVPPGFLDQLASGKHGRECGVQFG